MRREIPSFGDIEVFWSYCSRRFFSFSGFDSYYRFARFSRGLPCLSCLFSSSLFTVAQVTYTVYR